MRRAVSGDGPTALSPAAHPTLPRPPRWTKDPPPRTTSSPAIEALLAGSVEGVAPATDAFWAAVDERGTPLVDPVAPADGPTVGPRAGASTGAGPGVDDASVGRSDERIVTFLWRDRHGAGPGTRRVVLIANKLTDPSLPDESALERVEGTDVWWRAFRLSSAWRGTYVLDVDDEPAGEGGPDGTTTGTGGPGDPAASTRGPASLRPTPPRARGRWGALSGRTVRDARNPRTFPGPGGAPALSLLELPDAPPQPWNALPAGAPRGTVEEVRLPGLRDGDERRGWVYVPASGASGTGRRGSTPAPVPGATSVPEPHRLLVLLDGADWLGRRDAPTILDALHHAGRIPPTIALLVDSGVGPARTADLATGEPFLERLAERLPAWMRERYPVGDRREHLVLAGESMGGVAVLRAAQRSPELVGAVVAQSASLWWDGQEAADAPSPTVELLRGRPPVGVRVHLHVGRDEWILLGSHRAMGTALTDGGVEHALVEFEGGHDAVCWRGGLADGLIAVLGPAPLGGAT